MTAPLTPAREAPLMGRGEAAEREWLSKHGADRFSRPSEEFLRATRRRDWLSDSDDLLGDGWVSAAEEF